MIITEIAHYWESAKMEKEDQEVVVTNIKMPLSSMVIFMVKLAIATIPAMIILSAVGSVTFSLVSFFLRGTPLKIYTF